MPCQTKPMRSSAVAREGVDAEQPEVLSVDLDRAGRGAIEPADQVEDRRLPGAARADDREELARRDVEVDSAERDHPGLGDAVDLVHVPEPDQYLAIGRCEQLGADHRHSASPRNTPVTDERIRVRIAAQSAIALATTIVTTAAPIAGQSSTRTGGG